MHRSLQKYVAAVSWENPRGSALTSQHPLIPERPSKSRQAGLVEYLLPLKQEPLALKINQAVLM